MSPWDHVGTISPLDLVDARLEAHHAAQWLARATRAFCTPAADDSHTSMAWNPADAALTTQALSHNLTLGLRINPLSLIAKAPQRNESLSLMGRTEHDVQLWMADILKDHQLDASQLDAPGPYTLPKHPLDSGLAYGLAKKETYEELAKYFSNAAGLLETVIQKQSATSPVRCWPHHFDMATLISLDTDGGEHARSIGVGLSPGDESYQEPYFYVSPWPYPAKSNLLSIPSPAFWHHDGFTAVILKSSDVAVIKGSNQQQEAISSTLDAAIKVNRDLLQS